MCNIWLLHDSTTVDQMLHMQANTINRMAVPLCPAGINGARQQQHRQQPHSPKAQQH
jgi:hypothetical protein